jgi:BolA family transcriptional regulator, general stress-responsive regulator
MWDPKNKNMNIKSEIENILKTAFSPEQLEVFDDSEKHFGHSGYQAGGQSHFRIIIKSSQLELLPRLQRHRRINEVLAKVHKKIHALEVVFK